MCRHDPPRRYRGRQVRPAYDPTTLADTWTLGVTVRAEPATLDAPRDRPEARKDPLHSALRRVEGVFLSVAAPGFEPGPQAFTEFIGGAVSPAGDSGAA